MNGLISFFFEEGSWGYCLKRPRESDRKREQQRDGMRVRRVLGSRVGGCHNGELNI